MTQGRKRLIGQLVAGKAERRRFSVATMLDAVSLAADAAGLSVLIFWPSGDERLDHAIRGRARSLDLELYLWLPVLADAGADPDVGEQTEDAWGDTGHGRSGAWPGLNGGDETFLFACPRSGTQLTKALARCRKELADYDGVFLDRIRYPSFANGLEAAFTCFCPRCRRREADWEERRDRMRSLRQALATASTANLREWDDLHGLYGAFGLSWTSRNRTEAIRGVVTTLSLCARELGKKVGLDLFTPSLAGAVGQDYRSLSALCDWIKPMSYCHAKGPAGIPLELASLARGLMAWGPEVEEAEAMAFVARSFDLPAVPATSAALERDGLDETLAGREYALASGLATCPVYPGFECVRHPDFDLAMTEDGVRRYLTALADAPGAVLSWNILYSPETFLRLAAMP